MLDSHGLGNVAANNDIAILFPQGDVNGRTNCWDGQYPGYTGTDNWSHEGVQVEAIMGMINRLKEARVSNFDDYKTYNG